MTATQGKSPPAGLYVHLPWCVSKCPYCDFNSHELRGPLPQADYTAALLADLAAEREQVGARRLTSVFFGGGTPSLFAPEAIGRVIAAAGATFELEPGAEITLEANPGTTEHHSFAALLEAGVNRVSLGAQSFDDRQLLKLGRIHCAAETRKAVASLRGAGLDNFNLDLMFGLPGQELAGAVADVNAAIALEPAHISHYQLTLEPNTLFHAHPPVLPDDDLRSDMQAACHEQLAAAGYRQYEVAAFARPGRECRHNLGYWCFNDYLGIGAGAHGKWRDANGATWRSVRPRHPGQFLAANHASLAVRRQRPTAPELAFEYALNLLRLHPGQLDKAAFEDATGQPGQLLEPGISAASARGLLAAHRTDPGRYDVTERGWRFLNDLQECFLPPSRP